MENLNETERWPLSETKQPPALLAAIIVLAARGLVRTSDCHQICRRPPPSTSLHYVGGFQPLTGRNPLHHHQQSLLAAIIVARPHLGNAKIQCSSSLIHPSTTKSQKQTTGCRSGDWRFHEQVATPLGSKLLPLVTS
ncbi:unnamed protein product [Linum tenue]|uniref:Uncharacterized protein n=1 Tax=Linum tenue TaxID=586396 RepID=A0AAV0RNA6_9ROSI|nr:unnamed protein product [Linum tenue]